jgi:hypothetical protein
MLRQLGAKLAHAVDIAIDLLANIPWDELHARLRNQK